MRGSFDSHVVIPHCQKSFTHRSMADRQNGHPTRNFAAHTPHSTCPHGMQAWSAASEKHMLHWHGPAAQPGFDRTGVFSPSSCPCGGLLPHTYSMNSHSAGPGSINASAHEQYYGSCRSTSRKNWPLYFPTPITPPCCVRRYSLKGPNAGKTANNSQLLFLLLQFHLV